MDTLDAILESYVAVGDETKDRVLGAAFIVVDKDGVIYQGSAGRTDLPVESPPFTVNSFSWIASMTKIITAAAIMRLVERGALNLDDDMRPLVPPLSKIEVLRGFEKLPDGKEKPVLEPNTKPITLRQLLTHTVGLGYDLADPDLMRWSKAVGRTATNLDYTLEGWTTPLKFPPGEGWYYGSAIDWAAQALVAASSSNGGAASSLSEILTEAILEPLGMRDTTFFSLEADEELQRRKVACSFRDAETGQLSTGPLPVPADPPVESGGAGLWSTCADHAKLLRAILAAGAGEDGSCGTTADKKPPLLRPETVEEMFRPQLDGVQREMLKTLTDSFRPAMAPEFEPGMPLDHGITGIVNLADAPGKRRAGSMMWMGMANAHWWIDRKTGIAASLIVNVMPLPDLVVIKMFDDLERALYAHLGHNTST